MIKEPYMIRYPDAPNCQLMFLRARYLTLEYSSGLDRPGSDGWTRHLDKDQTLGWYRFIEIAQYNAYQDNDRNKLWAHGYGYNNPDRERALTNPLKELKRSKAQAKKYAAMLSQQNQNRCFIAVMEEFYNADGEKIAAIHWNTMTKYEQGRKVLNA